MTKAVIIVLFMNLCINAGHAPKIMEGIFRYLSKKSSSNFVIRTSTCPLVFHDGTYYILEINTELDSHKQPISRLTYKTLLTRNNTLNALYLERTLSTKYAAINRPLETLTLLHLQTLNTKNIFSPNGGIYDMPLTQEFIDEMIEGSYKDLE